MSTAATPESEEVGCEGSTRGHWPARLSLPLPRGCLAHPPGLSHEPGPRQHERTLRCQRTDVDPGSRPLTGPVTAPQAVQIPPASEPGGLPASPGLLAVGVAGTAHDVEVGSHAGVVSCTRSGTDPRPSRNTLRGAGEARGRPCPAGKSGVRRRPCRQAQVWGRSPGTNHNHLAPVTPWPTAPRGLREASTGTQDHLTSSG